MKNINWVNTVFLFSIPLLTILGLYYHIVYEGFEPLFFIFALISYACTGMSITGGYHRLFAHRAYKAKPIVRFFYLIFGAAAFENSCLEWASDHRQHHREVDTDNDPYNIRRGFFYAHLGWICLKEDKRFGYAKDLENDQLVMWQHRHYVLIAVIMNLLLAAIGWAFFGKFIGALTIVTLLRILWVHHSTFFVNSLAHYWGSRPYDKKQTARDNLLVSLVAWGEGYHNYHHTFQSDYRNGIKWYHFDPTKWLIKTGEKLGFTSDLKKASDQAILRAKMSAQLNGSKRLEDLKLTVEEAHREFIRLKKEYKIMKKNFVDNKRLKLIEMNKNIQVAKLEFQFAYKVFLEEMKVC